ncbi:MAG TPA: polysaccharide biosynthesis/export family protein [Candidatus Ozemobacteraceae bacterium]|nr:polysaccharide biosynthesis/export family protein [Candidatus Ozemobacteraceae bacterium]
MYLANVSKKLLLLVQIALVFLATVAFASEPLLPGDQIHIWVKGEPDLTVDRTVGQEGSINFPLIGSVKVAELIPAEAAKLIARKLDDGYIREPLVQINRIGSRALLSDVRVKPAAARPRVSNPQPQLEETPVVSAEPLATSEELTTTAPVEVPRVQRPVRTVPRVPAASYVEIIDGKTGAGVRSAVMLFNGKIFQTNSAGQMKLDALQGHLILMADGYSVVQGQIQHYLKPGVMPKIVMDPIPLADEIEIRVVDVGTSLPLSDVQVKLNGLRAKTNRSGTFRIKELKAEYSEVELSKKGYRTIRQIIDSKDSRPRTIALVPAN